MAHLRRINRHNNTKKKNGNTLSCDDGFYYPAPAKTPDLKSDDQVQAKEAKKNVA